MMNKVRYKRNLLVLHLLIGKVSGLYFIGKGSKDGLLN
jgi:hypothetical protein